MKGGFLVTGIICLLFAVVSGAGYIATTISTDGSAFLSTSGSDINGSFASRALTVDASRLARTVSGDETESDLVVSVLDLVAGVGCAFYYIYLFYDKINPKDLERYGDYSFSLPGTRRKISGRRMRR